MPEGDLQEIHDERRRMGPASRAEWKAAAAFIASNGNATSIKFLTDFHPLSRHLGPFQRIDHGQERKAMEIAVEGADSTDAMFAHQYRGVQVVHHVAAKARQFRQRLLENRRMTGRRDQQFESR